MKPLLGAPDAAAAASALALERHRLGDLAGAERGYLSVLSTSPQDPFALHMLGVLRSQQGRLDEAVDLLAAALRLNSQRHAAWLDLARVLADAGRTEEALRACEAALGLAPGDPESLHARGLIHLDLQDFEAALCDFESVLKAAPADAVVLNDQGHVLCCLGRLEEALSAFERALRAGGSDLEAFNNRGNVLARLRRYEEAVASYDAGLALKSDVAEILANRGLALSELRRFPEAMASYDKALAVKPALALAWSNRGVTLRAMNRLDEALDSSARALATDPTDVAALNNTGKVLCEIGRIAEGFAAFARAAALSAGGQADRQSSGAAAARLARHQQDQNAYRKRHGLPVSADLHVVDGEQTHGPAVAADRVLSSAEAWARSTPRMVVVDDLLTPAALEALRRLCWGSTFWRAGYDVGYVGAFPETGFAAPLLAQIAEELRRALPEVIGPHGLLYAWAFNYDEHGAGTHVHADEAAVNVNFWITPNEANLDMESGGLVIWDKAAPADWDYGRFNADPEQVQALLRQEEARATVVPYRCNRAVIFDSDLFHATDRMAFRPGYLNRRINITMLFGRRRESANAKLAPA